MAEPTLNQSVGYGIVLGLGALFALGECLSACLCPSRSFHRELLLLVS
jgi:hypothetical protein